MSPKYIPDDGEVDERSITEIMDEDGIEAAVCEHVRRRKDAYVKMGTVDAPPDKR